MIACAVNWRAAQVFRFNIPINVPIVRMRKALIRCLTGRQYGSITTQLSAHLHSR
ncbi:hypothetical protein D3C87_696710 [compost metagenome]|nr:hypothetical protein PS934_02372 [Pseudomonas fluorescens]